MSLYIFFLFIHFIVKKKKFHFKSVYPPPSRQKNCPQWLPQSCFQRTSVSLDAETIRVPQRLFFVDVVFEQRKWKILLKE